VFVARNLNRGNGMRGESTGSGVGVLGESNNNVGVYGISTSSHGVFGYSRGTLPAISGYNSSRRESYGVRGETRASYNKGAGVQGVGYDYGSFGVMGENYYSVGVRGVTRGTFPAVEAESMTGSGYGLFARSPGAAAVKGVSTVGEGVLGETRQHAGVKGICSNPSLNVADRRVGGFFDGGVIIINGLKPFTIDHPLDPENKYLVHTSVESPEMKNVYDGVAQLDADGEAWVSLPEWFEALNGDFRYQLTAVGGPAPNLHVAEEISENRFKMAGGEGGMKVCWQVTGSRRDPWATANPFEVEQEKPEEDRGRYLEPSLYDAPEEQRAMIRRVAEGTEEERQPPQPSGVDSARLEEEHRLRIDELRRLEERLEEEERREMEERQEEAPPEST
jgi:hypothetical protein